MTIRGYWKQTMGAGRRVGIATLAGTGLVGVLAVAGCSGGAEAFHRGPVVIDCLVSRQECAAEALSEGALTCATFDADPTHQSFHAMTCLAPGSGMTDSQECFSRFCTPDSFSPYGFGDSPPCSIVSATRPAASQIPSIGVCSPDTASTHKARVAFQQRSRQCTTDPTNNVSCTSLDLVTPSDTRCIDISQSTALEVLDPPSDNRDKSVSIIHVVRNDPSCPLVGETDAAATTYALTSSTIGTATGGGLTVPIPLLNGFAQVSFGQLETFRVNVGNLMVNGTPLTNVVIRSTQPARFGIPNLDLPGLLPIPAHGLQVIVEGNINGVPMFYRAENRLPMGVRATATTFSLSGVITANAQDQNHLPLPVSVSVATTGVLGSPQTVACAGLTATQRLFGFEDVVSWSSPQFATTLVTSPVTQGCGALSVSGQGYFTINSGPFSTRAITPTPAVSVDLFIPNNQPNPFYLGAMQMYLTCPSGNAFNQYIGQVELTGKPQNRYSTLRFPLPSNVLMTLRTPLDDCFFSIALNVNQTGRAWLLDNLRFTQ